MNDATKRYPALSVERLTGQEAFHRSGSDVGFDVLDFWKWACSDLASNTLRGILAEYLVGQALGLAGGVRKEWNCWDLKTREGVTIEVKSSAYLQTWPQDKLSDVTFGIRLTKGWDAETGAELEERKRHAQIYVFALLHHREQKSLDPLDLDQWTFFVVPTRDLDRDCPTGKTISLGALRRLGPRETSFGGLVAVIADVARALTCEADKSV